MKCGLFLLVFSLSFVAGVTFADSPFYWRPAKYSKMTSPAAVCVQTGADFTYQFAFEAAKPYDVKIVGYAGGKLPEKVSFDPKNGVLAGNIATEGERMLTFVWTDEKGENVNWGDLKIKVRNGRRHPDTLAGETIYQLQIQGFDRKANFRGVRKHLKRLADLGVTWVYLSPITMADRGTDRTYWSRRQRKYNNPINPYRPHDYYRIEPNYGTEADFRALVDEAHALGMKVMIDVVFFHCGPDAALLKDHPDWVLRDEKGKPVRNEWMFPTLNIANPELRTHLIGSLVKWTRDFGVDGYRTDCGCDTPLEFWEKCAAEVDRCRSVDAMSSSRQKERIVWLLEGNRSDYMTAYDVLYGFNATMNNLQWHMDRRLPATCIYEAWLQDYAADTMLRFRGTDTHDVANNDGERRQERRWGHKRCEATIALSFALDGPAWLFEGQEIGWSKPFCIFAYTSPDWEHPECPERPAVIARLAKMKKTEPAFGAKGRILWEKPKDPEAQLQFLRIAPDGKTFRCFFDLETGDWSIFALTTAAGSDVRFEPEAGARLQTKALQAAIDRAAANGGGRVVVPAGEWPIASVFFKPGTTLKLEKGATLKGSERREDYPETTIKIEGTLRKGLAALVNADRVDGFRIEGPGGIDGSGAPYWRDPGRPRPKLLSISRCRGVTLADVTLKNSPFWTCHIQNSSDILVTGCTILSEKTGGAEPINTDAIDLDGVENVHIRDSYMDVNNDAVALKGGKGPDANDFARHPENGPCRNVLVENCTFGPLCFAGVTIGSECVVASNVVLRNSRFNGSGATLYIKMRLDTPQLYTDIVATNLSGRARQGLHVKPYLSRSRPEWEKLVIPSVATNVVYDPGPAFTTPNPQVVIPHPACHLHLSAADGEMSAKQ